MNAGSILFTLVFLLSQGCGVKGNLVAYVDAKTGANTTKDVDQKVDTAPNASDQSNTKAVCSNDAPCPSIPSTKGQKTPGETPGEIR